MNEIGNNSFIKSFTGDRRHHSLSTSREYCNCRNSYEGKLRTSGTSLSMDDFKVLGNFSVKREDTDDGKAISLGTSKELFSFDFGKERILIKLTAALTFSKKVYCRGESMALTSLYLFFCRNNISQIINT